MKPEERALGIHAVVLATLLIVLGLMPWVGPSASGQSLLASAGWTALLASCFFLAERGGRIALVVLIGPSLIVQWLSGYEPHTLISRAAILGLMAVLIVSSVFRSAEVRLDQVLGGIGAYLLVGLGYSELHQVILLYDPSAYLQGGVTLGAIESRGGPSVEDSMLYFSFTTFTTLGYGDIAPATAKARFASTSEAVVGQLFIAILIARLVATYSAERFQAARQAQREESDRPESEPS